MRRYTVHFDDGDVGTGVPEHYIFPREEYDLQLLRDGNDDDSVTSCSVSSSSDGAGGDPARFEGVTNVTDESSPDPWAAKVGWWEAEVDGRDACFGLLTDALRARDAEQIRRLGAKADRSSLGIPEDYDRLFNDVVTIKRNATRSANEEAREAAHEYQLKLKEKADRAEAEMMVKFQVRCDEEVRRAVGEAVSREKKEGREARQRVRKEMERKHEDEMASLGEELRREMEEEHESEMASLRKELEGSHARHCQSGSERGADSLKPVYEVGVSFILVVWSMFRGPFLTLEFCHFIMFDPELTLVGFASWKYINLGYTGN